MPTPIHIKVNLEGFFPVDRICTSETTLRHANKMKNNRERAIFGTCSIKTEYIDSPKNAIPAILPIQATILFTAKSPHKYEIATLPAAKTGKVQSNFTMPKVKSPLHPSGHKTTQPRRTRLGPGPFHKPAKRKQG